VLSRAKSGKRSFASNARVGVSEIEQIDRSIKKTMRVLGREQKANTKWQLGPEKRGIGIGGEPQEKGLLQIEL
jgi:hypothetical protein